MVPLRWTALAFLGRLSRLLPARLAIPVLITMLPVFSHQISSPSRPVLSPRDIPLGKSAVPDYRWHNRGRAALQSLP
jgi:hypothetical protein